MCIFEWMHGLCFTGMNTKPTHNWAEFKSQLEGTVVEYTALQELVLQLMSKFNAASQIDFWPMRFGFCYD